MFGVDTPTLVRKRRTRDPAMERQNCTIELNKFLARNYSELIFSPSWSFSIPHGGTGYSYESIFGPFLNGVREVLIEDPHIREPHQLQNFRQFCMLCKEKAQNLRSITLITLRSENDFEQQRNDFGSLVIRLRPVRLIVEFYNENHESRTDRELHDRKIQFDSGWTIKIGRGLDYFQWVGRNHEGFTDMDRRPCKMTEVDIFFEHASNEGQTLFARELRRSIAEEIGSRNVMSHRPSHDQLSERTYTFDEVLKYCVIAAVFSALFMYWWLAK